MSTEYKWAENYSACRLQFDFVSLIKVMTFAGFCVGVTFIPILLLFGFDHSKVGDAGGWAVVIPIVVVVSPVAGALNGTLSGLLGYPIYRWLSEKYKGQVYTGIFVGLKKEGG